MHSHYITPVSHILLDWRLPILPTTLQTFPTFGNTETATSQSTTGLLSATSGPTTHRPTPQSYTQYPKALPPKLIKKILALEYIDMADLQSDHWDDYEETEPTCCSGHSTRSTRRTPVTNILTWLDCYASLVSVLCSAHPEKFGQFMTYQRTIIKAHRRYAGDGWVIYDSSYRRQAANMKSLDWGLMDGYLWNEIFTGRAKAIARCRTCLSELHSQADCPEAPDVRFISAQTMAKLGRKEPRPTQGEICKLFNDNRGNRCTFQPCKYAHVCSECQGRHPLSQCRKDHPYPPKRDHRRR